MEVLAHKPFNYAVVAEGENAAIVVVCGTSALFDVGVKLTRAAATDLLTNEPSLNSLLNQVRLNPGKIEQLVQADK